MTKLETPKLGPMASLQHGRGETYINLKIGSPDFGPTWVRCRLVKLEKPAEDGATHIALWEPRD